MGRRRRRENAGPNGLVVLDKAFGPTSFSAMRAVERRLGASRAGHAGTLDPAASGVLVVLLGEATKLSSWIVGHDKAYRATIAFGRATDTLDATGETVAEATLPPGFLTRERVEAALPAFLGEQLQLPPRYSAIKKDGRSLMSRARAGEEFEVEPRQVVCHGLEIVAIGEDRVVIDVACGSGYYVRSLARDLGQAIDVPSHLAALVRTRSGPFTIAQAKPVEVLTAEDVNPIHGDVMGIPTLRLEADDADAIGHGRTVAAAGDAPRALVTGPDGAPLALVERTPDDRWRVFRGLRL
ncbi:MAG: tRNA pseudouridine(55) synthase TruB [Myxococcales bacterium]|nr:tRNA pseudouridine(55) synthase TruB [Myxococcales bacterium]MCB9733843.1 tRNA pseudouridine(55) synthase TruB [Deltaproteobacteria bacterium]